MNRFESTMIKLLKAVYTLYLVSLATSKGGMELFGWIGIILLAGICSYAYFKRKENLFVSHPINSILLLLAISIAISTLFSPFKDVSVFSNIKHMDMTRTFLFFPFNLIILTKFYDYKKALKLFLYVLPVTVAYALLQRFTGFDPVNGIWLLKWNTNNTIDGRLLFKSYVVYACVIQFYVFVALAFTMNGVMNKKQRILLTTLSLLLLSSAVFSYSRAILPALFAGIILQAVLSKKRAYILVILLTMIASVGVYYSSDYVRNKINLVVSNHEKDPRYDIYKTHLAMFKEYPIKGVGWNINGNLTSVYSKKMGTDIGNVNRDGHSNIIHLLSATGVTGLTIFLVMWIILFVTLYRSLQMVPVGDWYTRTALIGLSSGLVSFFINGLIVLSFGDLESTHNLMFVMALAVYISSSLKQNNKEPV